VGLLAGASTVPEARRQGAQLALLEARLRYAFERGCDLAMMCARPRGCRESSREGLAAFGPPLDGAECFGGSNPGFPRPWRDSVARGYCSAGPSTGPGNPLLAAAVGRAGGAQDQLHRSPATGKAAARAKQNRSFRHLKE
jgi:hypothetical protein